MPSDNEGNSPAVSPQLSELRSQVDRLSAENLVLKQHSEFTRLFAEHEKTQAIQFADHKKYVDGEITKRLVAMTIVGLVALGFAWYQTITPIRKTVQDRLNKEFASDNIRTMISQAAQKAAEAQAKQLMETIVKPTTDQALADIRQHRDEVSAIARQMKQDTNATAGQLHTEVSQQAAQEKLALESLRKEYTKEVGELKALVAYQEKVKDIQLLSGKAVFGDFESFNKLDNYSSPDQTLTDAAHAAALDSKGLYLFGDRSRGTSIWMQNPDGTPGLKDETIPTKDLIGRFLLNPAQRWEYKAKAAQLLVTRREADVPPALITAMNHDPNLWVRRAALRSFEQLTGFPETDVFGFSQAAEWWDKNKEDFLKTIPKK